MKKTTQIFQFFVITLVSLFVTAMPLSAQSFNINKGEKLRLSLPKDAAPVVGSAAEMLRGDMLTVLDASLSIVKNKKKAAIICSIDASLPREGFRVSVSKGRLNIAGADSHGLAFGLLELSRMMGVSPWEWWADCVPAKRKSFSIGEKETIEQSPKVAFRGIFINDEDWGMNVWAQSREPEALVVDKFLKETAGNANAKKNRIVGAIGPKTNEKLFQLMLRLRCNYYWPAMHECTQPFFLTPGNRAVAEKYGIYIGGSHCEPMACSAAAEWGLRGEGEYNYVTNADGVKRFWQKRLDEVKAQDIVYTIGMRGVHDGAMEGVKTREDKLKYLQMVIDDQREMLQKTLGRDAAEIPQVFVPYKEVLETYRDGLRVPEDVTLMWTDDNYGYIRQFPTAEERARKGGNGLYYHASYWGRPHDYLWLATLSPYLMEQQLTEAYNRGIQQMWILNVGDVKPAEFEIELFADLAWHGPAADASQMNIAQRLMQSFYAREFGDVMAGQLAPVMNKFYQLAWDRKPEHMAGTRVEEGNKAYWQNTIHPIEYWTKADVTRRVSGYQEISDRVEALWKDVPAEKRDAFFQLVKYPVQGSAQMNFKFLCPERSLAAFDSIVSLTKTYNEGFTNGGKWHNMMSRNPRSLLVFDKFSPDKLPVYSDENPWQRITPVFSSASYPATINGLGTDGAMLKVEKGESYTFETISSASSDTLTLRVRLLPNLPVDGKKLTFSISFDGDKEKSANYETYDRSEEWKQNVFRNYAERILSFPIDNSLPKHTITFKAITEGVVLSSMDVR